MDEGALRWTNAAGFSWLLEPILPAGWLLTGDDNEYVGVPGAERFRLLPVEVDGELLPQVRGFTFLQDVFIKQPAP